MSMHIFKVGDKVRLTDEYYEELSFSDLADIEYEVYVIKKSNNEHVHPQSLLLGKNGKVVKYKILQEPRYILGKWCRLA